MPTPQLSDQEVRDAVRERYAESARISLSEGTSCCATACCEDAGHGGGDPITSHLYDADETPFDAALAASLGCGNPTALAELREGEVVLDLGSGGGIDVLLSARRVGPTGKAYGLDMTDEMLALAQENKAKAGATNVEFLRGHIEAIPLPSNSVDVIISNCVINLSADKDRVLREAFRVLRPGGRFAVSDVVTRGDIDPQVRASVLALVGCIATPFVGIYAYVLPLLIARPPWWALPLSYAWLLAYPWFGADAIRFAWLLPLGLLIARLPQLRSAVRAGWTGRDRPAPVDRTDHEQ